MNRSSDSHEQIKIKVDYTQWSSEEIVPYIRDPNGHDWRTMVQSRTRVGRSRNRKRTERVDGR